MKAKTEATTAEKVEQEHWWRPQLDTPVGRVELNISDLDHVTVKRAGWLELYHKYAKPSPHLRVVSKGWAPPHLDKHARRALDLTPHIDDIDLTRAADGSWKPEKTYRARRDREIAQAVAEAVNAWMAVEPAMKNDLMRRCETLQQDWLGSAMPLFWCIPEYLAKRADTLSAEVTAGVFDFNDGGRARTVATKMAVRLRQMIDETKKMEYELREAYTPTAADKAAA